jgi:16S rRNA (cytosine967-C5)-methyltransferase
VSSDRAPVSASRQTVFRLLQSVERGRRLDVAWEEVAPRLTVADRGWTQELAFGVLRLRGRLDHLLDLHLDHGLASVAPPLLSLLRMGAYQLVAMGSVPPYAAVSQTVAHARMEGGRSGAGLVNAVLRRLAEAGWGPERFPGLEEDPVAHLTSWGSHPRWLVERWLARWGPEETSALVEANNRIPRLYLRPVGLGPDEALRRLAAAGLTSELGPEGSGTVRLPVGADPANALAAAPGVIQDPGAALVVRWIGQVAGLRVADLCAAPGGKGIAVAGEGGRVVGLDPSRRRLLRMRESTDRLGLPIPLVVARAEAPPLRPVEIVLLDAPCTGTGTLSRHPDARWRLEPASIPSLAALQDALLDGAAGVVAPGGLLVYATCTLEPEENDERVEAFLRRHGDFILEGGGGVPEEARDGAVLRVLPQRLGTDGSFAARLRRR